MMDELPEGWAAAPLGAMGHYINGRAFKPNEWKSTGLPIIRIQNLNNPSAPFNYARGVYDKRFKVREGDLLIAWSASLGAFIWEGGDAWLNQHIFRVEHDSRVCTKEFLLYAVRQAIGDLYDKAHGSGMVHVTKPVFEAQEVPLPPLSEQRRIAEKLEKLLAEVERCKERMEKIPVLLKRFRQSVLAAACSGRLTADWRETHNSIGGIDSILGAIFKRKTSSAKTVHEKQSVIGLFQQAEEEDSDTLPEQWKYVYLNKLCDSFNYGTSSKSHPTGAVPVLRMGNIQGGKIDWRDLVYTSDAGEIQKYSLHGKTVLFNRTNSPELVGKTAMYQGERPAIFAGYLIRINPLPELDPEYLNLCLNTNYAHEFCQVVKTDGVSQSNINAKKLGRFEIPFCSLEEQQEIVRCAGKFLAMADHIEERYQGAKKQMDGLTQSILAKAFRGELVPTEAELATREGRDYESAEELLARIKRPHAVVEQSGSKRSSDRSHKRQPRLARNTREAPE